MPPFGTLSQTSPQHLDLLYALAYPKKIEKDVPKRERIKQVPVNTSVLPSPPMEQVTETPEEDHADESKPDEEVALPESSPVQDVVGEVQPSEIDDVLDQINKMTVEGEGNETEAVEDTIKSVNLNAENEVCGAEEGEAAEETDDAHQDITEEPKQDTAAVMLEETAKE